MPPCFHFLFFGSHWSVLLYSIFIGFFLHVSDECWMLSFQWFLQRFVFQIHLSKCGVIVLLDCEGILIVGDVDSVGSERVNEDQVARRVVFLV